MAKKTIAVLFGGQSSEHEVSCLSAVNIISSIDTEKYEPVLIGITKEGAWLLTDSIDSIRDGSWKRGRTRCMISPDAEDKALYIFRNGGAERIGIDLVYPALHGLFGEDGTVQGLCRLAGIPFVGCGVVASAVGMDKGFTKLIVDHLPVRQAEYELITKEDLADMDRVVSRVESHFAYPVFLKPCNAGSSCGVTKAENREALIAGFDEAEKFDRRFLVEETIIGREIECAVLGGGHRKTEASGVGEILSAESFYTYDAKYNNPVSRTVVDPDLPAEAVEAVRTAAIQIFDAIDGYGFARVDFFVKADGTVVFNEINTLPGFTAISMYPMLWDARGISRKALVNRLIELGFERN